MSQPVRSNRLSWRFVGLALAGCAGTLVWCAGGQAYAEPLSGCPGVNQTAYDDTAIIDTTSFSARCVPITGAVLSMNGAVAPVVDFGEPAGLTTMYIYDSVGRIHSETDVPSGAGATTYDMIYDSSGRMTSETTTDSAHPSGITTTYQYDSDSRLIRETSPSATTTYIYDGDGRVMRLTDSSGTTDYGYDTVGRTVTATEGSATTIYAYDADNRVTRVTDPAGHVTQYQYDGLDRRINEIDPLGATTIYQYDPDGNIVRTTDPTGNVTTYSYDSRGRIGSDTEGTRSAAGFVYSPPVPEPSSLLLLLAASLVGGLGIGWQRRSG